MTGSLLVTYSDDIEFGGDYLNITKNSVLQKRIYNDSSQLYSIPLAVGDVITLEYVPLGSFFTEFSLLRRDYTSDNENADDGIKETVILSDLPLNIYTFTATTLNNAYDFEYVFDSSVTTDFQILTELSEPIMTENDDYINQQY